MRLAIWVPQPVLWVFAGLFGLLVVASGMVALLRRGRPEHFIEVTARVRAWWWMSAIFALAVLVRRDIAIAFFALLSYLALKEYLSLIPTRRADRRTLFWVYLCVPLQYLWVGMHWYLMFLIFIPVWALLFLAARMTLRGETRDFLRALGTLQWGLLMMVFALSHLAYLLVLPDGKAMTGAGAGLLLYVVLLTELNDVLQFLWGKTLGRRKVLPTVSPGKTVEGLAGGVLTTTLLAVLLAPWLTPMDWNHALAAGLLIGMGGFLGDVTVSAIKRDIGVKDSGSLIPGHGGILDRIDSLLFTAPLFFHYIAYFYY
jgi:phosphatidate cytidylyltransferase